MPKNKISYDWAIKTIDLHGDIIDITHVDLYPGPVAGCDVCLVRDAGNDVDGLVERQWVYIRPVIEVRTPGGRDELPERFDIAGCMGVKVPQRFHKEVEAWHKKHYTRYTTRTRKRTG